mmetsp:Transcript_30263/g.81913  ORF Transcript_30263/g.81913 Transcript_30263/m.81913 type:complete len:143 (+) Transcript_30263:363-791(+)
MPANATTWVVTATRSPFHQKVSAFFENAERKLGSRVVNMTVAESQELFRASKYSLCPLRRWFTNELLPATGVDLLPAAAAVSHGQRVIYHGVPGGTPGCACAALRGHHAVGESTGFDIPRLHAEQEEHSGPEVVPQGVQAVP